MKPIKPRLNLAGLVLMLVTIPIINVQAAVVFEDEFDGITVEKVPAYESTTSEWTNQQRMPRANVLTAATVGGGQLQITTQDSFEGGVMSKLHSELNFFDNELTFTWSGIGIQSIGISTLSAQNIKIGVISKPQGDGLWSLAPHLVLTLSANGRQGYVLGRTKENGKIEIYYPVKFRSDFVPFDLSMLTKIQLTMNATHFKVTYEFGNELNQLTFGGAHTFKRELWMPSGSTLAIAELNKNNAYQALLDAQDALAAGTGTQAQVDDAQLLYDTWLDRYNTLFASTESQHGKTALFIMANSSDSSYLRATYGNSVEVGTQFTLDAVRVETSNILQGIAP